MGHRWPSVYAAAAGLSLLGTWLATWAGILPAEYAPVQLQGSHVVAEVVTGIALLVGAALSLRAGRPHWSLAVALGALAYATLNVMSDFSGNPLMLGVLAGTLVVTAVALVAAFWNTHLSSERRGG